jgi:hypothetical protein
MRAFLVTVLCLVVFGCGGNQNADDFPAPQCSDGIDNDGDGAIDFPDDLGCVSPDDDTENSPTSPQCDDGRDNDGDGKADYPNDPGCFAPQSDSEEDDCPDGPYCPQCGDGEDNDLNGLIDYPNDPGCESAADTSEFLNNPVACGPNMKIKQLPTTGMDTGTLDATSTSNIASPCGGGGGAPAIAYVFQLSQPKVIQASTDDSGTTADTVLDIRSAMCSDPSSEIACSDDIDGDNRRSMLTRSLQPGTYYLIVSGHDTGSSGNYTLYVQMFNGEGTPCANQDECGPGLLCRQPINQSTTICAQPACNDGLDDDGDGLIDYPNDPGCASPNGNNETDNCPGPGGCPECANTLDDDGDGLIDYPADPTCKAAGDSSESCVSSEGVELIIQRQTTGTTVGAVNDFNPSCDSSTGAAPDKIFRLDLPGMTSLTINTTGFDVVQQLLDTTCTNNAFPCQDPSLFTTGALAAGTYYLVVDGYFTSSQGAYTIDVSGRIANGQRCDNSPLLLSGALSCNPGFACKGAVGNKTCQVAQCNDGVDNNGNGVADFPADPGCDSISDDTETTVCPGASCPACSDGVDNDMDGLTDYPNDPSCIAASGTSESCVSSEGTTPLTAPATMGDTSSAIDDIKLSCASSTSTAKDIVYEVRVPAMQTLTFNVTSSFDAVYALLPSSCQNPSLACTDFGNQIHTNLNAGTYFFVVDGWSSGSGTYTVNVSGTIKDGERCDMPLAESGAISCLATSSCQMMGGVKRCQPAACSDGIDNNGDGKIDYPNDPGCSSPGDPTETTVCPGPMCPVCANGIDDDGDGAADFVLGGGDFGCSAAGSMSEGFCPGEPDVGAPITAFTTTGTLATAADNYDQTCQSNTGNDMVFPLQLPVPVASLVIDTNGSTIGDTVISLKDAQCADTLPGASPVPACDDDSGDGFRSLLTVTNLAAGNYAIQVDSFGTSNNGAFTLHVKGTVAPQTACTSPLFSGGANAVLQCPTGTTCTGGRCQ